MIRTFLSIALLLGSIITTHLSAESGKGKNNLYKRPLAAWSRTAVLKQQLPKKAKTAILIISPLCFADGPIENRWKLGKEVWERYMNSRSDVDCYFITCTAPKKDSSEEVWQEGNTIYVADRWTEETGLDKLLHKTVRVLKWLEGKYTHYIRTNINTFFNVKNVASFAERYSQSFFTTPLWENCWYAIGYSIFFTSDVAKHIVSQYQKLESEGEELISPYHSDDGALTALATGIFPEVKNHPFRCCPTLKPGVRQLLCPKSLTTKRLSRFGALFTPLSSLAEAKTLFDMSGNEVILYRTRDGLSYGELKEFYEYMMKRIYPGL